MALIQMKDVTIAFEGQVAVDRVSLSVEKVAALRAHHVKVAVARRGVLHVLVLGHALHALVLAHRALRRQLLQIAVHGAPADLLPPVLHLEHHVVHREVFKAAFL